MKKAPKTEPSNQSKSKPASRKSAESPEWNVLKSGAMKHKDGKWYASAYGDGWFFYTGAFDGSLGPFKSFEDGLKDWSKKA